MGRGRVTFRPDGVLSRPRRSLKFFLRRLIYKIRLLYRRAPREHDFKKEFPDIFPRGNTIGVGRGWHRVIHESLKRIAEIHGKNEHFSDLEGSLQVTDGKEKFGTLRLYLQGGEEEVQDLANFAEWASQYICEECGTTKGVTTEGSWLKTLCPKCRERRYKEW